MSWGAWLQPFIHKAIVQDKKTTRDSAKKIMGNYNPDAQGFPGLPEDVLTEAP
jgi:hypothetical protein